MVPVGEELTLVNLGEHHVAFYLPMPVRRVERATVPPAGWSLATRRLANSGGVDGDPPWRVVAEMPGPLRRRETEDDRLVLIRNGR
jgi:hypothetical protein